MKRLVAWLAFVTLLQGCRETMPTLSPHSIEAAEIAELAWILFLGGLAILVLVAIAAGLAIGGPAAMRKLLAGPYMVLAGGVIFPGLVLTALLFLNLNLMQSVARTPFNGSAPLAITVTGEQWWWRVVYNGAGVATETANDIRIPVGRDTVFTLRSADVIHAFWVPSLGGKIDMIPGRDTRLRVHATRPGSFRGPCAEYCGSQHALMALDVAAMPPPEFDAWLAHERSSALPSETDAVREGETLFHASGCGTCHAVRGTQARGSIGPDLTHIGGRRSLAAGALPLNHANLARFIAEGQSIKPGNRMPEFRILTTAQRNLLASYLVGLK